MGLLLHALQAVVYALIARELLERWWGDAVILGLAAVCMGVGGLATALPDATLRGRRELLVRGASALALLMVAVVVGRFGAQALHVVRVFGPLTGEQVTASVGSIAVVLPYLVVFPAWRVGARFPAPLLLLGLFPALEGMLPYAAVPGPADGGALAAQVYQGWVGSAEPATLPEGADVRLTPIAGGEAGRTSRLVSGKAPSLPRPGVRPALLVEIARETLPRGFVRPGTDAPVGRSPALYARNTRRREVLPGFSMPALGEDTRRFESFVASDSGVVKLDRGWAPGPELSPEAIDAAVRSGADHLIHNLGTDGGFTYIVEGPSGKAGSGYNYPRHAGTSWYLARVAAAFESNGPGPYGEATDRAIAFLDSVSRRLPDGRAFVLDPSRKDGKSWAGTTALAALASLTRGRTPELSEAWVRQLAASVDERGQVRGDMSLKQASFPEQAQNGYGQGQVVLALAVAERHGIKVGEEALTRAIRFLESEYVGSAHPLITGDEHWMCLTAHAILEVRGVDVARGICKAYVAATRFGTPEPEGAVRPSAGPGGGLAEAVVAHAWNSQDPAWMERSLRWGKLFLDSQYRSEDSPFLGAPLRLIGGFRDGPGQLDVQIDAVQHIGSALLGVEALLSGRARPGSLP